MEFIFLFHLLIKKMRKGTEISAGSMADIAFLLLIFFLVTTTMDVDIGIGRKLPPMPEGTPPQVPEKNILKILINKNDRLLVNNKESRIYQLKPLVKEFFLNPNQSESLPGKKKIKVPFIGEIWKSKGIISLKNDRGTSYEMYIQVQNELTAAINELRNDLSNQHFGMNYNQLTNTEKIEAIRDTFPMAISEAEPQNTGGN
jgi:biopolymer transport protein ExbD